MLPASGRSTNHIYDRNRAASWVQVQGDCRTHKNDCPLPFTDNVHVSKDIGTEMQHLPLLEVRKKGDDWSQYLQKTLPAGIAGTKTPVPNKGHDCMPQISARTSFFEVSQKVAREWTLFFFLTSKFSQY